MPPTLGEKPSRRKVRADNGPKLMQTTKMPTSRASWRCGLGDDAIRSQTAVSGNLLLCSAVECVVKTGLFLSGLGSPLAHLFRLRDLLGVNGLRDQPFLQRLFLGG